MRIIRIKFSNINNLKGGPWEIEFDENPIRSAGLFAITGPTGSGKSTLLDVITLALFNRIPRFQNSISTTKMEGLGSVLTRNANKGYAEVEYEVKGDRFISRWSIARNRNGKLKDYEMSLQDGNGIYLDLKRREIPAENEKIIGLNYQQFLKSIILAQGEFSKFIKAEKDERSKLLEQLTGTSIYRKIGIAAFNKYKSVSQQLEQERASIKYVPLLNEEQIVEFNKGIATAKKEKLTLDQKLKEQAELIKIKTDLRQQQQAFDLKQKEFQQIVQEQKDFQPELKRLSIHEKLSPAQSELTRYRDAKINKEKTATNLQQYQNDLKLAQQELEKAINRLGEITNKPVDKTNFKTEMDRFEKEINQLDFKINGLKEEGKRQRTRINLYIQEQHLEMADNLQPDQALSVIKQSQHALQQQIQNCGLNTAKISDSELLVEQNNLQLKLLDNLKTGIKLRTEKEQQQQSLQVKSKKIQEKISQLNPLIVKSTDLLKSLEENKLLLDKQEKDAQLIKSLEEHRLQLTAGEPCPLCGSEEHPFAHHLPDDGSDELKNKLQTTLKKIETESTLLKTYQEDHIRQETELKGVHGQLETLLSAISHQNKEILDLTKQLSGNRKGVSSEQEAHQAIQQLSDQTNSLKQGISASRELKTYETLFKEFDQLRTTGKQYSALLAERQTKYSGKDISDEVNPLQDRFNDSEASVREINKAIEIESKDLQRAQKMLDNNLAALQPKLKEFGLSTVEELSAQLLEEKEVTKLRQQQNRLTEQHTTLSTEINGLSSSIETLNKQDSLPELSLALITKNYEEQVNARETLASTIVRAETQLEQDKENRSRIKTQQALITKLEAEVHKWDILRRLIGDAEGKRFAAFAQALTLKNLLVLANHRLERLSDRYLLDQPTNDGALNVVDQYQGNAVRAISTLSGGESFMVSLALALSLSDMASRNNPLDSLFIDEGFGSLDQETLGIAIDTLERLQAESSKTVGVISHVEALKERIDVQIQLERGAQGFSTVSVKG